MRLATRLRFSHPVSTGPYPSTLPLSGWWAEEDYVDNAGGGLNEGLWTASRSAGTSLANGSLVQATVADVPVAAAGATFDGASDYLASANTIQTFVSINEWLVAGRVHITSAGAHSAGAPYTMAAIVTNATQGMFYITTSTSGISAGHYDSTTFQLITKACPADGSLHRFMAWFDGTNLNLTVDGVAAVPVPSAVGFPNFAGNPMHIGRNYNASAHFHGRVRDLMTAATDLTPAQRTGLDDYLASLAP